MVGFVFIGPILMASQTIVNWVAVTQISSDFVKQEPLIEHVPSKGLADYLSKQKSSIDKVTLYTDSHKADIELKDGGFQASEYEQEQALINRLDDAGVDHEQDSDGDPGDALAERLSDDSTAGQVGASLQFPALLGLIVALVYVPLQAVRAGLLPRFFGTLGMALGVSIILRASRDAVAGPLVRVVGPALCRQGAGRAPARLGGRRGDPRRSWGRSGAPRRRTVKRSRARRPRSRPPASPPKAHRAGGPAPASANANAAAETEPSPSVSRAGPRRFAGDRTIAKDRERTMARLPRARRTASISCTGTWTSTALRMRWSITSRP